MIKQGGHDRPVVAFHPAGMLGTRCQVALAGDHRDAELGKRADYRIARHRVDGGEPVDRETGT